MARPTKEQAIARLRRVIDEAPGTPSGTYPWELDLDIADLSEGFSRWHRNSKMAVEHLFGTESRQAEEFSQVNYHRYIDEQMWFSFDSAIDLIESMMDEIEEYGLTAIGSRSSLALSATVLQNVVNATDYESVKKDLERALTAADDDPESAITSACSTVESVCKCILEDMNRPLPQKKDIRGLVTEVSKHLNLSPGRTDIDKDIEIDVKQILSGLVGVTSGIGALRTHSGDAHGRGVKRVQVDSRIARLAINAASTISLFYIETRQRMEPEH